MHGLTCPAGEIFQREKLCLSDHLKHDRQQKKGGSDADDQEVFRAREQVDKRRTQSYARGEKHKALGMDSVYDLKKCDHLVCQKKEP